jgi:hypothetical protein
MERLSAFWTAPFPEYAPTFLKSRAFGYILSGMMGTGLIFGTGVVATRGGRQRKSFL